MSEKRVDAAAIKRALCDLTVVDSIAGGFEISLPQLYGNGDVVVVTAERVPLGWVVHDRGNAARSLENRGISLNRFVSEIGVGVQDHQCQFIDARVVKHAPDDESVAVVAAVVGSASKFVADLVYKAEPAPLFDFRQQMVDRLMQSVGRNRIKENATIVAASGSSYQVSAAILSKGGENPSAIVEAVSNHEAVARKFRSLYDISKTAEFAPLDRICIYNDRANLSSGDKSLLKEVCQIVPLADSADMLRAWQ